MQPWNFEKVGEVGPNVQTFTDSSLNYLQSYYYRVIALNDSVRSRSSDTLGVRYEGYTYNAVDWDESLSPDQAIVISPDGTQLVLRGWYRAYLLDSNSMTVLRWFGDNESTMTGAIYNLQGDLFATTEAGRLSIWRAGSGTPVNQLRNPVGYLLPGRPGFNPNEPSIAVNWGEELQIWNWQKDTLVRWSLSPDRVYQALAYNEAGTVLMAATTGGIDFWDPISHTRTGSLDIPDSQRPFFTTKGDYVIFWSTGGASIWKTSTRSLVRTIPQQNVDFSLSPDGAYFLLAGSRSLDIYETATGNKVLHEGWPEYIRATALGPRAESIVVASFSDYHVRLRRVILNKRWTGAVVQSR